MAPPGSAVAGRRCLPLISGAQSSHCRHGHVIVCSICDALALQPVLLGLTRRTSMWPLWPDTCSPLPLTLAMQGCTGTCNPAGGAGTRGAVRRRPHHPGGARGGGRAGGCKAGDWAVPCHCGCNTVLHCRPGTPAGWALCHPAERRQLQNDMAVCQVSLECQGAAPQAGLSTRRRVLPIGAGLQAQGL